MPGQTRCQNRRSRALGVLLPKPYWKTKQNNLTHPHPTSVYLTAIVHVSQHSMFSFQFNLFLAYDGKCEHLRTLSCWMSCNRLKLLASLLRRPPESTSPLLARFFFFFLLQNLVGRGKEIKWNWGFPKVLCVDI